MSTQQFKEVEFSQALGDRYLAYALSTIMSRSLPDVRDGLKPVHRRLIYAMLQLKLDPKSGFKKCARIVGDVIGKYHPHGEIAVYDALVRMAQYFASRYPLVNGQGNFGSVDGDSQAAMRYTEAKLTEYALLLISNINEDTVDFRPNYDGSDDEPVVLPASVPNILANGTEGIAVGMATSIPPHNLFELCDATLQLIKQPETSIEKLCTLIQGPDFPTGGVLIEPKESILRSYATGRGSFKLRANWYKEELERGQYRIIIDEIPYQVQKRNLIEKMAELFNAKKMPFLDTFQDMSAEDVRIVLIPKTRNLSAESIMESMFKLTDLEVKVQLNMNVLNSRSIPKVMDVREVLLEFIDHRKVVSKRRLSHRLQNINHRLEILAGLLIVYLNLDEVIRIIREEDEPKEVMIAKWNLSEVQVESILNTRLRSLRKLEEFEIRRENDALLAEKQDIEQILADPDKLMKVISDDLKEIRAKYSKIAGFARKTKIAEAPDVDVPEIEIIVEREPITVTLSEMGWLKSLKGHRLENIKYKEGDGERYVIECLTTDKIVIYTNAGKFYAISADKISRGKGDGDVVRMLFEFDSKEQIISTFRYEPEKILLLASKDGKGFLVEQKDVLAQTKSGKQIMTCSAGDAIICREAVGSLIACIGENRRLIIFPLKDIPVMKKGRGVTLQKYKQGGLKGVYIMQSEDDVSAVLPGNANNISLWKAARASQGRLVLGKTWLDK